MFSIFHNLFEKHKHLMQFFSAILLVLLVLVFSEINLNNMFPNSRVIGTIDEKEIDHGEYMEMLDKYKPFMVLMSGRSPEETSQNKATQNQILFVEATFRQMEEDIKEKKFTLGDITLADKQKIAPFTSSEQLQNFKRKFGISSEQFEKGLTMAVQFQRYQKSITENIEVNKEEVEAAAKKASRIFKLRSFKLDHKEISEANLKGFYQSHKKEYTDADAVKALLINFDGATAQKQAEGFAKALGTKPSASKARELAATQKLTIEESDFVSKAQNLKARYFRGDTNLSQAIAELSADKSISAPVKQTLDKITLAIFLSKGGLVSLEQIKEQVIYDMHKRDFDTYYTDHKEEFKINERIVAVEASFPFSAFAKQVKDEDFSEKDYKAAYNMARADSARRIQSYGNFRLNFDEEFKSDSYSLSFKNEVEKPAAERLLNDFAALLAQNPNAKIPANITVKKGDTWEKTINFMSNQAVSTAVSSGAKQTNVFTEKNELKFLTIKEVRDFPSLEEKKADLLNQLRSSSTKKLATDACQKFLQLANKANSEEEFRKVALESKARIKLLDPIERGTKDAGRNNNINTLSAKRVMTNAYLHNAAACVSYLVKTLPATYSEKTDEVVSKKISNALYQKATKEAVNAKKENILKDFAAAKDTDQKENVLKKYAFTSVEESKVGDNAAYRSQLEESEVEKDKILVHEGASVTYMLYIMDIKESADISTQLASLMEKKRAEKTQKVQEKHSQKIQDRITLTDDSKK